MTIRVALVEDQRLVREILEAQLAREADLEIVGTAGRGRDAIEMARRVRPDVLIIDLGLPDIDGVEVARAVHNDQPAVKLIVLTVDARPERVHRLMGLGAHGYVVKSGALQDLLRALHAVMRDEIYVSPALRQSDSRLMHGLGRRERGISPATVESHRRNIMRKLNLHSVAELTKFALRAGLTSL